MYFEAMGFPWKSAKPLTKLANIKKRSNVSYLSYNHNLIKIECNCNPQVAR